VHPIHGPMISSARLMQQKLLIQRLQTSKGRKGLAQGFTLIELMIVVAIIGVLSAVAIPQFLGVRDRAAAGAKVGELVGLAKECAVGQVTKVAQTPAVGNSGITITGVCDGSSATAVTLATANLTSIPAGVKCLADDSAVTDVRATISITQAGAMTCAWS
jgi:type IV pilus assembly protein PilA